MILKQGKTNRKYILIVLILAVIVGGVILCCCSQLKQKPPSHTTTKKATLKTDKENYIQAENISLIFDPGDEDIYILKYKFGEIIPTATFEVYQLQNDTWVKLRLDSANVMICDNERGPVPPPPAPPPPIECRRTVNPITWTWDQKAWEYVTKTCIDIPYTSEELKQVDTGTYKIRVNYYDSGSCDGIQKHLETQFNIETDETADCLKKYPVVVFEDCIPGEVVDGWWGTILYPNTLDTSNVEHYIDAPAPDIIKQAGIASYGASRSTCQTTWFIKIDGEWKEVSQIEFCNYIIDYNSSCNNCLLEWEEGCC